MPTYYVDFEGGNDANAGTSFATRWKTLTSGATTARIAAGDEIRVMASPDPTSMGSATWTGGGRPASVNISSSTNASPIVITTSAAHGLVTGGYVSVTGHTVNTNANGIWRVGTTPTSTSFQLLQIDGSNTTGNGVGAATGNITNANNLVVKTASALVQNIALCGGLGQKPAWTASASVTTAQTTATVGKEGAHATEVALAAGFTTGKAAYYTLPATLNLSGFQQVSFWVRQTAGTLGAAGAVYVALCTDTLGDTVVHQCPAPLLGALNAWVPVTVNLGVNLNSSIRSVAFYVVTDNGAQTFQIDNIVACKAASSADSVSLQSLVSKSDGTGDEAWYAVQSINSDVIMLANANSLNPANTSIRGYNGVTETVTTYKRETVKTDPLAASDTTGFGVVNDSGNSGNLITFTGGWNRTDMSTQTGVTWLDGQNGNGRGLTATLRSFVSLDRLYICRYTSGMILSSTCTNIAIETVYATANSGAGLTLQAGNTAITAVNCWSNNNNEGISCGAVGATITNPKLISNNSGSGLNINLGAFIRVGSLVAGNNGVLSTAANLRFGSAWNCTVDTATITNSATISGILATASFNCSVNGGSSSGNAAGVALNSTAAAALNLNNFTINETTEVLTAIGGGVLYSNRHDDTDNNSWVWQAGFGTVNQQSAVVDSPATTSWQMRPTSTNATAATPLLLKLATVVCAASSLVTVTARMRRDDTGLTMRLVCPGGQISGVATDVSADMTAAANTWETVTITFTPSKAGAVDIYAHAFGGTTFSGYVCNITASQA